MDYILICYSIMVYIYFYYIHFMNEEMLLFYVSMIDY